MGNCHHCHHPHFHSSCWILCHEREGCGCKCGCGGGKPCEKCPVLMAKLVVVGFDPCSEEDCMFIHRLVKEEGGNADKAVIVYAKWKSGFNSKWRYKN
ncbi:hypothetical protein FBU59_004626 [Linderina macrospora]|uniref:Uncharacterized protein n=1 Tax=Linderina macrospora TaxID=4868 RepID=A0ACC1J4X1_9FUNG|nr:hypothetical protein FBU59_004626 [Linderina macrospora]